MPAKRPPPTGPAGTPPFSSPRRTSFVFTIAPPPGVPRLQLLLTFRSNADSSLLPGESDDSLAFCLRQRARPLVPQHLGHQLVDLRPHLAQHLLAYPRCAIVLADLATHQPILSHQAARLLQPVQHRVKRARGKLVAVTSQFLDQLQAVDRLPSGVVEYVDLDEPKEKLTQQRLPQGVFRAGNTCLLLRLDYPVHPPIPRPSLIPCLDAEAFCARITARSRARAPSVERTIAGICPAAAQVP